MLRYVWWHTCRHRSQGPVIFPIRKTRTNSVVPRLRCAIITNHRPNLRRASTHYNNEASGGIMFVPKIVLQLHDWYTVRRVSFMLSHTHCALERTAGDRIWRVWVWPFWFLSQSCQQPSLTWCDCLLWECTELRNLPNKEPGNEKRWYVYLFGRFSQRVWSDADMPPHKNEGIKTFYEWE